MIKARKIGTWITLKFLVTKGVILKLHYLQHRLHLQRHLSQLTNYEYITSFTDFNLTKHVRIVDLAKM